jgi:GR25 family glycosyltransferase involved in LPS biosynthesis
MGEPKSYEYKMKIFVITLKKSTSRQESIRLQFQALNLPFEFFYGINGMELTAKEINLYYDDVKAKKHCGRSLVLGEIGCAISHRLVYKKIVEENIDRAIILEDDSLLKKDFLPIVNFLSNIKINKFVIKLDLYDDMRGFVLPCHQIPFNKEYKVLHSTTVGFARGYYIDKLAAKAMLCLTERIFFYADSWDVYKNSIRLRILNKSVVGVDESFVSTIWGNTEYRHSPPPHTHTHCIQCTTDLFE